MVCEASEKYIAAMASRKRLSAQDVEAVASEILASCHP